MDSEETKTKTEYAEPDDDPCYQNNNNVSPGLCEDDNPKLREGGY